MATVSLMFILCIGIGCTIFSENFHKKTRALQAKTKVVSEKIEHLRIESKQLFEEREEYLGTRQRLLDQATFVNMLNRVSWSQVFSVFAKELPEEVALKSFKFSESGKAHIKGMAFQMDSIAAIIRRIEDSAILEDGKFDFLRENNIKDKKVYDFSIFAKLKNLKGDKK